MSRVQFEDNAEEAVNRRQTMLAQKAVTGTHTPAYRRKRNWTTPLVVGGGLAVVLAALYVVFVR
jgi:hypothetical protein